MPFVDDAGYCFWMRLNVDCGEVGLRPDLKVSRGSNQGGVRIGAIQNSKATFSRSKRLGVNVTCLAGLTAAEPSLIRLAKTGEARFSRDPSKHLFSFTS